MCKFIVEKISVIVFMVVGITFLSFLLSYLSPSDPAEVMLKKQGIMVSEEALEQKRTELGLDQPMLKQYTDWLSGMCRGNLGVSYKSNRPVADELLKTIPYTVILTLLAMALTMLISIPMGIMCARYRDGVLDQVLRFITYLFSSLPSFFLSLIFLHIFALRLGWLPVIADSGMKGVIMPAMVLSFTLSAWYIRQVRAIILREMNHPYVQGAMSRGVPEHQIFFRHILKNSMMPLVTLIGISFGVMLGGTTIVESIFSWPGVGKLAVDAITSRDYPVIQGYVVWMALIFLGINAVTDFVYACLDPRIRRGKVKA